MNLLLFDSTLSNVFRQLNTRHPVTRLHFAVRRELLAGAPQPEPARILLQMTFLGGRAN